MQETPKPTANQPDEFSRIIRQKLESHELPVDASCWAEIEARLGGKKKKRIVPFWWWTMAGGAVAAMIALLIALPTFDNPTNLATLKTNRSFDKKTDTENKSLANPGNRITLSSNDNNSSIKSKPVIKSEAKRTVLLKKSTQIQQTDLQNGNTQHSNVSVESEKNANEIVFSDNKGNNTEKREQVKSNNKLDIPVIKNNSNKKPHDLMIAATIESGANITGTEANMLSDVEYSSSDFTSVAPKYSTVLSPGDFQQKNYKIPLSFGLSIRTKLNKVLGVETGLVYSLLQSEFSNTGFYSTNATLDLHYLGVPLKLTANIWKKGKWEVSATAGPMFEKGLHSLYVQQQNFGTQTITTKAATSIDGWQWSAHAGIGISYELMQKLNLYVEPSTSYYFDNNQPISIRTEYPLSGNLRVGIRYDIQ